MTLSENVEQCAVSDPDDKEAAKRKEANRKKREKAKAKKAAAAVTDTNEGRWLKGLLPGGRAERRDAGESGLGVFALEPIAKGEVVASAVPALSVIFDAAVDTVCSYCFEQPEAGAVSEHEVELVTSEKGFGIQLDTYIPQPGAAPSTIVTRVTNDSANAGTVMIGDRIIAVEGTAVDGGHEVAVPLLQAAVKNGGKVRCKLARPALLSCPGCRRFSCCSRCLGEGHFKWHSCGECAVFQTFKGIEAAGESATVRMLLRHKMSSEPKVGEWCADKEPVSLLSTLQANRTDVPPEQLANLSRLTGLAATEVASLIYQIRTNAAEITRGGTKVGCALSVLMGWHNHDCLPSAQAIVDAAGLVTIQALRDIAADEEVKISYVDATQDYEERRRTLEAHYGFECKCGRCAMEKSAMLKKNMELKRNYLAGQRR